MQTLEEIEAELARRKGEQVAQPFTLNDVEAELAKRKTSENGALDVDPARVLGLTGRMVAEGGAGLAGLVTNPLNAGVNEVFGTNLTTDLQATTKQTLDDLGVAQPEGRLEESTQTIGRNLATAGIPAGAIVKGAKNAGPVVTDFIKMIANNPGKFLTAEGLSAFGSGVGEELARDAFPESPAAPLAGALTGGIGPNLIQDVAGVAINRVAGKGLSQGIDDVARLDIENGISPSLGTLSGSEPIQRLESFLRKAPGGKRIIRSVKFTADALSKKVSELGSSGETSSARAGRSIRAGLFGEQGFVPGFNERAGRMYDKLDEFIPATQPVQVSSTSAALNELTAAIPGAEATSDVLGTPFMKQIASAFRQDAGEGSEVPYQALKQLRSAVGRKLSGNDIVNDAPKAELNKLYGALTEDMEAAALAAGPDAASALKRANKFYKSGLKRIEEQFANLNRKSIPEDIFKTVLSGSAEGGSRLNAVKRSLSDNQWKVVVDTVVQRLGRATNSNQDDIGEAFSSETFLTNWNKLAPDAKDALFGNAPEYRKNMDIIARMASRLRESARVDPNPSGTGVTVANVLTGGTGALALSQGNVPMGAAVLGAVVANASASWALTNPSFVKWAAKTSRLPARRLPGQIVRLNGLVKENPELLEPVQAVIESLSQNLVASPETDGQ